MRRLVILFAALLAAAASARDGQHDFDFNIGTWKTHIRRLTGSHEWSEMNGTVSVRKVWDGRANLEEIEADGPAGHFEGLTMRLYDPAAHQWNLTWANANAAALGVPTVGAFENGRGEFHDQESIGGRTVLVRQIYSGITKDAYHFEQAFSSDHGRTWEPNFVADLTRIDDKPVAETVSAADRDRGFDFNFGRWTTHVSRLLRPLTGSTTWAQYDGTSDVGPVWSGRASVFELNVSGPAGKIEGLGVRLFNRETHEWSLNWANGADPHFGVPTIGGFDARGGEFVDQETFGGRAILVRNSFGAITRNSARFEQAFSADGGKTWETNWIMTFTREK